MRAHSRFAALLLAGFASGCATPDASTRASASAPSAAPVVTRATMSIPIEILKPEGPGPFPAVVVLHDCSGLGPRSSGAPKRWAHELLKEGYVVAIPDSFSTRGAASGVCVDPGPIRMEVAPMRRVKDAYETLDYLRAQPFVDGRRIGVMGGSHGGSTTLASVAVVPQDPLPLRDRKRQGFAAAIAFYPGCNIGRPPFTSEFHGAAPLLILTGELDDWTPASPCKSLVEAARRGGSEADIKVYPGAHHSFDSANPERYVEARVNASAPSGRGATTGGNAAAWQDAIVQVKAFFAARLKT
jgi:dienelactone hydrolase